MMLSLGICLLAATWLFFPPSRFPDVSLTYWLIGGAVAAFVIGKQRETSIIPRSWSSLPAAAALIICYVYWNEPITIGALILGVGIILGSFIGSIPLVRRISEGLVTAGAVLLVQLGGSYLYYFVLGPRGHDAEPWSGLLHSLLSILGIDSGITTAGLYVLSPDILYQVVPSLNNMGWFFFIQVFLGVIVLVALGRMKVGALWRAALILTVYMFFRYLMVVAIDFSQANQGHYWWPSFTALTSVWVFLFMRGSKFGPIAESRRTPVPVEKNRDSWRRLPLVIAGAAIAVICWTVIQTYVDPGEEKAGRLLIDEYHSDWEWTDMAFDTLWYGQQSTYNFYSGAEYWGKFYKMDRGYQEFTPAYLDTYDVICLKVPTRSYTPQEISAVLDWVKDGGGLVLIGDHTNVFGHATFLNQISRHFGLRVYSDIAYEVNTGDLNVYQMPGMLPHPVVQNLPLFFWGGQCTLRGDWGVRGVMVDLNVKTLPADYSERNFFPERIAHTGYRYGPFFTVASTTYGKGRIICFTDSTLISNFFIFIPGKPELMLGLVEYANRIERFPGWRPFLLLVGCFALVVASVAASAYGARGFVWMLASGLAAFLVITPLIEAANRKAYPLPEPREEFKQLVFDGEYSRYFIPELRLARNEDKDFHTFFVWTQRVDVFPRKYYSFDTCIAEARKMGALIMIDPEEIPTPDQIAKLRSYIEDGGTFVLMDDPENGMVPTNTLMQEFGLEFDFLNTVTPTNAGSNPAAPIWNNAARITGGTPLMVAPDGAPVVVEKQVGKGRVIAYGNSRAFERNVLGYTSMVPNPQQKAMSNFVYTLMDWIFEPETTADPGHDPEGPGKETTAGDRKSG